MTGRRGDPASDDFDDDRPPGSVIGSRSATGTTRLGRDPERALSIDHGALRIRHLRDPGWGQASIAYGPFAQEPGLAVAVSMLNGLTTSQTSPLPEGRRGMLQRWLRTFPRLRLRRAELQENLAVGWFATAVPDELPTTGTCLVGAASTKATGEIRLYGAGKGARILQDVQNVPVLYVLMHREGDVAVFAASQPGTMGFSAHPNMRPLGIVASPWAAGTPLYAGLHQSVLGEVKYRLDTRVYGVRVAPVPELARWFGTAHAADDLTGDGDLAGSEPEVGRPWTVIGGALRRTSAGTHTLEERSTAVLSPTDPSGLVRLLLRTGGGATPVDLLWRSEGGERAWRFRVGPEGAALSVHEHEPEELAATDKWRLRPDTLHDLEIIDDGRTIRALLDGELVFGRSFTDDRLASQMMVGFSLAEPGDDQHCLRFEAHPRDVPVPQVLDVGVPALPAPPCHDDEVVDLATDAFDGPTGDLAGTATDDGQRRWCREMGDGIMLRTGSGMARVDADRERPNPGRTIYTVAWDHPRFADVGITVVPPGSGRGEGHQCRSGLVFWHDEGNHLILNDFLDDTSVGVSISAFLRVGGHEEMYDNDAVWTNVGDRVRPGVPHRLRVVFDGERFAAYVGSELVLWRALTDYRADARRLEIRAVGLVANWEWGDDTGTAFDDFVARGPRPAGEG